MFAPVGKERISALVVKTRVEILPNAGLWSSVMSISDGADRPGSTIIPAGIAAILGSLPVLGTERQSFEQLLAGLVYELDPQDVIEWMLVWHLVDTDLTTL